jgi:hypothetical protein
MCNDHILFYYASDQIAKVVFRTLHKDMRFCFVFVLGFLVRVLEEHCCRLNWESTWVFETILEIGILLPVLHRIYDRIFKAKVTAVLIVYSSHYRDTLIYSIIVAHFSLYN